MHALDWVVVDRVGVSACPGWYLVIHQTAGGTVGFVRTVRPHRRGDANARETEDKDDDSESHGW